MDQHDAGSPTAGSPAAGDQDASASGVPPLPTAAELVADHELVAAVDDALIGDLLADHPETQSARTVRDATDISSLYIRHRSGLAALARRYLRDSRDVDEVVQETFLRLFLAIEEIETEMQAIAFARRTLTNLCIDRYRADRRRPTLITLDANPYFDLSSGDEEPDPVLQAEDAAIVREALARLSPLHRAALVKREIEEKALPQIAAELGVAEESVKHLLFRARRALRRLLTGTSVEPGIDLTGTDGEPHEGSPLLRGATVFILFLVGALVVATGLRPLILGSGGGGQPAAGPVGSAVPGLGLPGSGVPQAPPASRTPKASHPKAPRRRPGGAGPSVHPASSGSLPTITFTHNGPPAAHHPVHRAPATAGRGHFKLRGPLTVTGSPQVTQGGVGNYGGGSAIAASSFIAPTDQGTFELNQLVSTSASNGTTVTVTPAFVIGSDVRVPDLTGTSAAVGTDQAGNVTIEVVAGAAPDASSQAFPLTAVRAQLLLTPDLASVLSETVTLSTRHGAQQAPVSAGGTAPQAGHPGTSGASAGPGPNPGSGTASGTGSGSGSGTASGSGTGSGGADGTTSAPPAAGAPTGTDGASGCPATPGPAAAPPGDGPAPACSPADTTADDTGAQDQSVRMP
ncbi:MAG TPA: RNA polymerase sigma factor [Mycobacteriales bacterium]|nr:RNA polymerase sigma factor [Mycobacteriales bacterium]